MDIKAPVSLLPRKKCQIPTVKETGWSQQSIWTLWRRQKSLAPCWAPILKPHHYTDSMLKPFPQVFLALCLVLLAKCSYGTSQFASSPYLLSFHMTHCQVSLKHHHMTHCQVALKHHHMTHCQVALKHHHMTHCQVSLKHHHINKTPGVTVRAIPWFFVRSMLRPKKQLSIKLEFL